MARFSETLLEHARFPHNLRRDDEAYKGRADLAGGPPHVEIFLRLDGDTVVQATFQAAGCGVTVGACSALTDIVGGRRIEEVASIDTTELATALDGVPSDKHHVLDVAIAALRHALRNAEESRERGDSRSTDRKNLNL